MIRVRMAAAVAVLALAAQGCGEGGAEPATGATALVQAPEGRVQRFNPRDRFAADEAGDRRMPFIPKDDVAFIDFFVQHHEAAIQMGMAEAANGESERVRGMAEDMVAAQQTEIDLMLLVRSQLTEEPIRAFRDPHSASDVEQLKGAAGAQADRLFLANMIAHHAFALPAAHGSVEALTSPKLRALAARIYETQSRQIGDMKKLLGTLDAAPPPAPAAGREDGKLVGDPRIAFSPPDDVAFIDFFMPHHEAALRMATQVVERGSSPPVKDLARAMVAAQTREIAMMKQAREDLAGSALVPEPPRAEHMRRDMARLESLSGEELDRAFLEEMIPHHAAGIGAAHRGRPGLVRGDLREMAKDIFDAQAKEVGQMHQLLDARPAGSPED